MGFGSIIGGIGSAIGGIAGAISGNNANNANMAFSREQFEYQKELHKNQLQWRVEDAKKAGLHPMAALGLSSSSFSPVSSNMQGTDYSWIGDIGQSAGYAAMKAKDKGQQKEALALAQKENALQLQNMDLQNEGLQLENEYRRFQLQQAIVGGTSQALRSPGSARVGGLPKAEYAIPEQPDSKYMDEPINQHGFLRDSKGRIIDIIPSDAWKQRVEDTLLVEWLPWLSSTIKGGMAKVFGKEFDGYYWHSDRGEYLPYPPKKTTKKKPDLMKYTREFRPFRLFGR